MLKTITKITTMSMRNNEFNTVTSSTTTMSMATITTIQLRNKNESITI
jgi:hypothetical protein